MSATAAAVMTATVPMDSLDAVAEVIHRMAQEERPGGRQPLVCTACGTGEYCPGPDEGCPGRVLRGLLGMQRPVYVLALDGEAPREDALEELREGGAVIITDSSLDQAERACLEAVGIDDAARWMREQQGRRLVYVDTLPGEAWAWQIDGEGYWATAEAALADAERKLIRMVAGQ